jgi:hypothetical protein
MSKGLRAWSSVFIAVLLCVAVMSADTYADTVRSTNYQIEEGAIGMGDMNEASSANFRATNATGDIGIGNATSENFQVNSGTETPPDPFLSFSINNWDVNFDDFTPSDATTTTATFSVSNYTSYGYVIQIFGSAPSYGSHTIDTMDTTGPSINGIEQFGINLVANTSPTSFGTNPDNGQFGFGAVDGNYSTPNQFRFVSGETIASAPKSSGMTTYTISYIVNVSSITPGGVYTGDQNILVTGTY